MKISTTILDTRDFEDYDSLDFEIECMYENLKEVEGIWRIEGSLGLWDGRHTIEPVVCDNGLAQAVARCVENMDDFVVKTDGEKYYVDGIHHDGSNRFEIKKWH